MTTATLSYRHQDLAPFARTTNRDIEQVANAFRFQLGVEGRVALSVRDLSHVEALCVNGVSYEVWSDLSRTLFDAQGEKVSGIFEFIPEIEEDAVNVRVSPVDETFTPETVLSTFAHELGHAVFDGPVLIGSRQAQRALGCAEPVMAYRVTEGECTKSLSGLSDAELRSEWRANQFMGCLLVPRNLLMHMIEELAPKHGFRLDFEDMLLEGPGAGEPNIVCERHDVEGHFFDLIGHLSLIFGVSPSFIRTRFARYGLWDSSAKAI